MQTFYPVARSWYCAPLLVLAVSASTQAQFRIAVGAKDVASDEQRIEAALDQRGSLDVIEMPLRDVVQELSRQFQVQMVLVHKKLEEASVSADTPITKKLHSLPLESILRLVLADLELGFTVRDHVVLITTPEDMERQLETRVYPVLDLVRQPVRSSQGAPIYLEPDYTSLIDTIQCSAQPDTWDTLGGPGAITSFDNAGALVVSQTRDAHREIEKLLQSLRRVKIQQGIASLPIPSIVSQRATLPRSARTTPTQAWQLPQVYGGK